MVREDYQSKGYNSGSNYLKGLSPERLERLEKLAKKLEDEEEARDIRIQMTFPPW
jgi:hypothetical protein